MNTTSTDIDIGKPFREFAGPRGNYYADVFLKIQKAILPRYHINRAALIGSFVWAALRGNWLLFVIGFVVDLVTAVNAALVYKYSKAALDNAAKDYLVARYEGWSNTHLVAVILVFVVGRVVFSWLADRLYARHYNQWRVNHEVNNGFELSRLWIAGLVTLLIAPLLLYRTTQFAPDART